MENIYSFAPHSALRNPHLQTLISYVIYREKEPFSTTHLVKLEDQDQLAIEITTPDHFKPSAPTVLMMHGIGGSANSPYLVRLATKLKIMGIQAVRLNFRGIGHGMGYSKKISHGGSSHDLFEVIQYLKNKFPLSPLTVIGFSLSGNILLKLAGEESHIEGVERILAICPSVNLKDSAIKLEKWQNSIYRNSILKSVIKLVESNKFTYEPKQSLKSCKTLRDFDNLYTAPSSGFFNGEDYYQKCSSLSKIPNIEMPCHILFAKDDPLINCEEIHNLKLPKNIELLITRYGGHMGFLKHMKKNDPFWMDSLIFYWIQKSHFL